MPSAGPIIESFTHFIDVTINLNSCKLSEGVRSDLVSYLKEQFALLVECEYNITESLFFDFCYNAGDLRNNYLRFQNTAQAPSHIPDQCLNQRRLQTSTFYDLLADAIAENSFALQVELFEISEELESAGEVLVLIAPSSAPSVSPTSIPSSSPSVAPTSAPSSVPSVHPTISYGPTVSSFPSRSPSVSDPPTMSSPPSNEPTLKPSVSPSSGPSSVPS